MGEPATSLPDVPGLRALGPEFHAAFAKVCGELGIDADSIAALIAHESGFNPKAKNPTGGAVGLMQWMPKTLGHLGYQPLEVENMTALQQLGIVRKTFWPWRNKLAARDVPMVGFGSAFIGKPDDLVAYREGEKGYDWNKPLDMNSDGEMTLGEVRDHVLGMLVPAAAKPRIEVQKIEAPPIDGGKPAAEGRNDGAATAVTITLALLGMAAAARWGFR
jgi:hypothetical protein